MDFLYCSPCVFTIGNEYEILVLTNENGLISIKIADKIFYEENSGALYSERNYAKIRVPMELLDTQKEYTVSFRRSVDRKAYFSVLEEPVEVNYAFKPLEKTDNINIYHIADVHYFFEIAKRTASYFGSDLDLLIVNGDIGEVETVENYREVAKFVAEVSQGSIPTLFVRGNHDTRGRFAELYTDYFPANAKSTYFTFDVGPIHGIVFDCGEDKPDDCSAYGGTNAFEPYRRRQTEFFRSLKPSDKLTLAIGHICPAQPAEIKSHEIEGELYSEWISEFERLDTSLMICGHMHFAYILQSNDPQSFRPHKFPIVVGSACYFENNDMWGAAITISGKKALVRFTDANHNVKESHEINLK